jgi:hypothetical protein
VPAAVALLSAVAIMTASLDIEHDDTGATTAERAAAGVLGPFFKGGLLDASTAARVALTAAGVPEVLLELATAHAPGFDAVHPCTWAAADGALHSSAVSEAAVAASVRPLLAYSETACTIFSYGPPTAASATHVLVCATAIGRLWALRLGLDGAELAADVAEFEASTTAVGPASKQITAWLREAEDVPAISAVPEVGGGASHGA